MCRTEGGGWKIIIRQILACCQSFFPEEDLGLGGRILLIFGGRREVENIDKSQPLLPPVKIRGSKQGLNQIGSREKKDADSE